METVRSQSRVPRGYTLVEMMVVILIAAIFTALAVPSYKATMTQNRMAGELNDLTADLQLARSTAIREGMAVTICPATNPSSTTPQCSGSAQWNTGWIVFSDTSGNNGNQTYTTSAGDVLFRTHAAFTGTDSLLSLAGTGGIAATSITFNRQGGSTSFAVSPAVTTAPTSAQLQARAAILGYVELTDAKSTAAYKRCIQINTAGSMVQGIPGSNQSICP